MSYNYHQGSPDVPPSEGNHDNQQASSENLQTLENLLGMDELQPRSYGGGMAEAHGHGGGGGGRRANFKLVPGSGLEFEDLTYTVTKKQKVDGKWESTDIDLLQGITGQALKGQVTAIMGPSGAGKSTFLDALAGRIAQGSLGGTIRLDGNQVTGSYIKRVSAYVMQQDFLFPMLTVTETLMFSAEVRLPSTMSRDEKAERVQTLIKQLGLQNAAHTYIGDEGSRGVSGGERRRVSIGVDIIHGPSLCFLDEPTSGLDSTSALGVVEKLFDVASAGSTVLLTIHQPSYRIQMMLSRLIVLARGKLIYLGAPHELTGHMEAFGREVPEGENSMEYLLDLIKEYDQSDLGLDPLVRFQRDGIKPDPSKTPVPRTPHSKTPLVEDYMRSIAEDSEGFDHSLNSIRTPLQGLNLANHFYNDKVYFHYRPSWSFTPGRTPVRTPTIYTASTTPRNVPSAHTFQKSPRTPLDVLGEPSPGSGTPYSNFKGDSFDGEEALSGPKYANGWFREVLVLMWRNYYNILRTPELFLSREIVILVMGSMLASLFRTPSKNLNGVNELLSFYIFALTLIFFSSNDAVPTFIQERYIFIRETGCNAYRASSYTIASLIIYLPFMAIQAFTFVVVTWFVLRRGEDVDAMGFVVFWMVMYASLITTNSFVMFVSALVPNYITGYAAVIAFTALFFLTCGFFLKRHEIPPYWIWLHYASTMKYPFEALLQNEFISNKCFSLEPVLPAPGPLGSILQEEPLVGFTPNCYLNGSRIIQAMGINTKLGIAECVVALLLWGLVYRLLFYIVLRFYSKSERK